MTRIEALEALRASRISDRLRAARLLIRVAELRDIAQMESALSKEKVPWVRHALQQAIFRLRGERHETAELVATDELELGPEPVAHDSTRDTIGQVLHELTPAVGRLKLAALREVPAYETSRLAEEFSRLDELIEMFERWRRVNSPLHIKEFELDRLIEEVIEEEGVSGTQILRKSEVSGAVVLSDRAFFKVVVANGLRNAVQAVLAKGAQKHASDGVMVSFGMTDREAWVAINDDGVGLPGSSEHIFKSTTTTKPGHLGLGLPIALTAASRLGGEITLTPVSSGGARFMFVLPLGERP
jgi:signal transduction histidine kinase